MIIKMIITKKDNGDNNNCHNDNNYLSFLRFALATRPLHGNLHRGSYFVILCQRISHLSGFEQILSLPYLRFSNDSTCLQLGTSLATSLRET